MSTSFFVVPTFAPPTLEQLAAEPDDVAIIVRQEAKITQQLEEVREYHRDVEPLGVIAAQEELEESEGEGDEGLTSDEDLTEEEEGEEGDLDDAADSMGDDDVGDEI